MRQFFLLLVGCGLLIRVDELRWRVKIGFQKKVDRGCARLKGQLAGECC